MDVVKDNYYIRINIIITILTDTVNTRQLTSSIDLHTQLIYEAMPAGGITNALC